VSHASITVFRTGTTEIGDPAQCQSRHVLIAQGPSAPPITYPAGALFWGTIKSIDDSRAMLIFRSGELLQADLSHEWEEGTAVPPVIGRNVAVNGKLNAEGVLEAHFMWRVKGRGSWGADRRERGIDGALATVIRGRTESSVANVPAVGYCD
jgi:hypothetical protein